MRVEDIYPVSFDGSSKSFNSLINTLLIKASYDSVLKKITGFKGIYLSQKRKPCYTLKFENIKGVYGLFLTNTTNIGEELIGEFTLYYFPSKEDKYLSKCSLFEEYLIYTNNFINKVREFSSHPELLSNFRVATIQFSIIKGDISIRYFTQTKIRTFAKQGVADKLDLAQSSYIIEPNGVDKEFPAFRFTLPFFNFLNSFFTRVSNSRPTNFSIYKDKAFCIEYDDGGHVKHLEDNSSLTLTLEVDYSTNEKGVMQKSIHKKSVLYSFLKNSFWYKKELEKSFLVKKSSCLKPKLIVVTGFLGSGKTNFLQNFIEYETQNNHAVGVVQNEIGKTGLDGKLLDYDYNLVEIDEGCVCCSLAGQLKTAVTSLLEKRAVDTIILETTGVANPFNLLSEIDELQELIEFDSIITIVDAKSYKNLFHQFEVFKDQIRAADVILLNKIDLLSKEQLKEVEELITANNRCANILKTIHCDINPLLVSNEANLSSSNTNSLSQEFNEEPMHFRTHKDDKLSSIKKEIKTPLKKEEFENFLKDIPNNILRVKGIVEFEDFDKQFVVQYVNKDYEFQELQEDKKRENFLIYIGRDIKSEHYLH